ncbi:hypothetical protein [Streptomyces sp. NPDC006638]|uniref:hypothetical protein n=1 Tax=Streptomyces sp. NPDC006638 TaxID=3157183 RepID=UPI0033A20E41
MSDHAPRTPPTPTAPLTGRAPAGEARIARPAMTAGPFAPAAGPADPAAAVLTPLVAAGPAAAGPEAYGMTDRTAARIRHRDVFPLSGELYARARRGTTRPARADAHRPVPGAGLSAPWSAPLAPLAAIARVRPLPPAPGPYAVVPAGLVAPTGCVLGGARPAASLRPPSPDGLDLPAPALAPATEHRQARPAMEDTPGDGGALPLLAVPVAVPAPTRAAAAPGPRPHAGLVLARASAHT